VNRRIRSRATPRARRVALLAGVLLIQAATAPPAGSADRPGLDTREVVHAGQHGYHTYRIPAAVRTGKGTVLLFLEGRKHSSSDFGETHMLVLRSADGGDTWGAPRVVHKEDTPGAEITIGNPCPVYDATAGRVWLVFTRDNQQVLVTASDDDGRTWPKPRGITADVRPEHWTRYWTGPGHGIQLSRGPRAGRLLFPSYHLQRDGSEITMRSHAIYSDDHGRTWQVGRGTTRGDSIDKVVFKAGWIPQGFVWAGCECLAAELSDGRLYLAVRNQVRFRDRKAYTTSNDGGDSWSPLALHDEVPGLKCMSGLARGDSPGDVGHPDGASGDRLLLSCITSCDRGDRRDLAVFASRDGGRTWPVSKLVHKGPAAYSDLCVLPDGTVLCFFEGGAKHCYESIRLARFHAGWPEE